MPFSSGVFSRIYNWATDAAMGIKILAARMDAEMDGMATGLSTCLLRDGTSTVAANIPFNGKKITNLGTPTAGTDAATKAYADLMVPLAGGTMTGLLELENGLEVTGNSGIDVQRNLSNGPSIFNSTGGFAVGALGTLYLLVDTDSDEAGTSRVSMRKNNALVGSATRFCDIVEDGTMVLEGATPGITFQSAGATTLSATGGNFLIEASANVRSLTVYNTTTATAANMFVASNGTMQRSTSSEEYKNNITELDPEQAMEEIRNLGPVSFGSNLHEDVPGQTYRGFTTQGVKSAIPNSVLRILKDGVEADDDNYDFRAVLATLTAAVKNIDSRLQDSES